MKCLNDVRAVLILSVVFVVVMGVIGATGALSAGS
jgi:hypothetical protein